MNFYCDNSDNKIKPKSKHNHVKFDLYIVKSGLNWSLIKILNLIL